MSLRIIDRINYGYSEIEPIILGLMATNKNFLLMGRHGTGKTRLARTLSQGYGRKKFVFYDATKDDLISIAGIPNPEKIKSGVLSFTPHQRSIWDKDTIVVDEITRAGKENQNLWLEILEEHTCFGMPLPYRTVIATANPESYAAAFKLDDALLDRFYAVIPVPELQGGMNTKDISAMYSLSLQRSEILEPQEIARTFSEIQKAHKSFHSEATMKKVIAYCSQVVQGILLSQNQTKNEEGKYVSPRTYAKILPETLIAIAAYYDVAGSTEPLAAGAQDALTYAIGHKLNISLAVLDELHTSFAGHLKGEKVSEGMKLKLEISSLETFQERLSYLQEHGERVKSELPRDELEKFLGELLRGASEKGEKEKLVHLKKEFEDLDYSGELTRQLDGQLILTLNSAVSDFIPMLKNVSIKPEGKHAKAWENIERFKAMVHEGSFTSADSESVRKLKAFIIDLYEEELEPEQEELVSFFESIDLSREE